jgi:hopanoid biosynthesis associated RND transporter like protein HpnN
VVSRRARLVVMLSGLLTVALSFYIDTNLGMNTDTSDMLSSDLPFRQNSIALSEAFPQFSDNIVVVVDGGDPEAVNAAADLLASRLRAKPERFGEVFDPAGEAFFRNNGLLYLESPVLERLVEQLIDAQPFLGKLWRQPDLPTLFHSLAQIADHLGRGGNEMPVEAAAGFVDGIAAAIGTAGDPSAPPLSWQQLFTGNAGDLTPSRRIILLQPRADFDSLQPGSEAMSAIRSLAVELRVKEDYDVRVRLTGSLALADEELESVADGLGLAGILSLILVFGLLIIGLRRWSAVGACLITLICGLIWTAGFATAAIGTLNLISVAFAVLFIGLSVDFGIHFTLRYIEREADDPDVQSALYAAGKGIGSALSWTAVAAAIGFFSFLPTDYRGLAELGLIAGAGMVIALFANLTLLPALLAWTAPKAVHRTPNQFPGLTPRPIAHRMSLAIFTVLALAAAAISPRVVFDFDPLNLKDPETESVGTLLDLVGSDGNSPYTITILARDLSTARETSNRLEALDSVKQVRTIADLVPENQEEKLELISDASLILLPAMSGNIGTPLGSMAQTNAAYRALERSLAAVRGGDQTPLDEALARLAGALKSYREATSLNAPALQHLQHKVIATLPEKLTSLRNALTPAGITVANLPKSLRDRLVAADGRIKIDVTPKGNMRNQAGLSAFVTEVQSVVPSATGAPVVIYEASKVVKRAFGEAGLTTIVLIAVLVFLLTRNVRQIVLIFAPIFVAGLLTVGATVVLDIAFNFANIIVLPLLFGLGVAGSIHMVRREQALGPKADLSETSTPRAVVFSALTTICSFGSIALSSHPGTASMGVLLTIAIFCTLAATLFLLPALMYIWPAPDTELGEV